MVGGFSSSPYLKGRIKEEFKHTEKHIVNPIEAGSVVCRGALAFGAVDAEVMLSRKSKKTYGICVSRGFRMGDPQEYLLEEGGQSYCNNVFGVFVKKGEDVLVDRQAKHVFEVELHSKIFFTHDGNGWGLRTLEQLPAGAFVCECVGEILTNMEQEERNNNGKADPTVTHTYGARRKV
ncbi:hypothetical protein R1sor_011351 [Riccia sorocarpa]|uniref:Uncharacterized protein n=1 Tax=Riccia sorocarpa TaxID=122646 RepID=A0ABD3I0K9_9MARC